MPCIESIPDGTASGFHCIATADIEQILQQLTQDEKVALLTGMSSSPMRDRRRLG